MAAVRSVGKATTARSNSKASRVLTASATIRGLDDTRMNPHSVSGQVAQPKRSERSHPEGTGYFPSSSRLMSSKVSDLAFLVTWKTGKPPFRSTRVSFFSALRTNPEITCPTEMERWWAMALLAFRRLSSMFKMVRVRTSWCAGLRPVKEGHGQAPR